MTVIKQLEEKDMYQGWIQTYGDQQSKEDLMRIGVELGSWDGEKYVGCVVPEESMERLDEHWGRWFWSLRPFSSNK